MSPSLYLKKPLMEVHPNLESILWATPGFALSSERKQKIPMPKEKLYEAPWVPGESAQAENTAVTLSYYEVARKAKEQKEILYDSPWVSWERVRAGNAKAWIQQLRFFDRWLFLVTGIVRSRLSRF